MISCLQSELINYALSFQSRKNHHTLFPFNHQDGSDEDDDDEDGGSDEDDDDN